MESLLWLMIVDDLLLLMLTGFAYFRLAIGENVGVLALVLTAMSFNANAVTALFRHGVVGEEVGT